MTTINKIYIFFYTFSGGHEPLPWAPAKAQFEVVCITAALPEKSLSVKASSYCFFVFRLSYVIETSPHKMYFTRQHFLHQFCNGCLREKKPDMQVSKCFLLSGLLAAGEAP